MNKNRDQVKMRHIQLSDLSIRGCTRYFYPLKMVYLVPHDFKECCI